MKIAVLAVPVAAILSGCAVFPVQGPAMGVCIENEIDTFIGMDKSTLFATQELMPVRIIEPGMAVTQDYSEARGNFVVDANGTILDAYCG
jgi:hypothetical protein